MSWSVLEYYELFPFQNSYLPPRLYEILDYDYALCGAYAMKRYVPERATYALDVMISSLSEREVHRVLVQQSVHHDYFSGTRQYYILQSERLYLTTISIDEPWLDIALEGARSSLDPFSAEPTLPFEWLVFTKMYYGKRQDFMDCARLMARASEAQISLVIALLNQWLPESLDALRALYRVGKQELRFASSPSYVNQRTEYTPWQHLCAFYYPYIESSWVEDLAGSELILTTQDWPEEQVVI